MWITTSALGLLSLLQCPTVGGTTIACQELLDPTPTASGMFGQSVAVIDINNDGFMDVAVSATGDSAPGLGGRVIVFYGPTFAAGGAQVLQPAASAPNDRFGADLAVADVDADGVMELIVGVPGRVVGGATDAGAVSVWKYILTAPIERLVLTASTPAANERVGAAVTAGDFLGGSGLEIAAGAPGAAATGPSGTFFAGALLVFEKPAGLPWTDTRVTNPSPTADNTSFAAHLGTGDWDRDGRVDLVATAIFNDATVGGTTYLFAGQTYVFPSPLGGAPDVIQNPSPWIDPIIVQGQPLPPCAYQRFGMSLAVNDFNGDGYAEVLVGTPRKDGPQAQTLCDTGKGFLFSGRFWSPTTQNEVMLERATPMSQDLNGYQVHMANLVGDSKLDLLVGSLSSGQPKAVSVWDGASITLGTAGPPTTSYTPAPGSGAHFCAGIASGDLDQAGRDDLALGDPDYTPSGGPTKSGRVVISFWP